MKPALRAAALAIALLAATGAAAAEWQAVERVENYAIDGKSGIDLYRSIGEKGPTTGIGRTIAHTSFDLTWRRDYQPRDGGCVLAEARPNLVITYRLPKPSGALAPAVGRLWKTFIDGVEAHERVHGEQIKEMVQAAVDISVGLTVPGDHDCSRIRKELLKYLVALAEEQRRRSVEFDRVEMRDGGNVHQLILALVNGG